MSDAAHLLIPFASSADRGCVEARRGLKLPALEKLLARLGPVATDEGDDRSLSMPHERALAGHLGLGAPDGRIPWAAWQVARSGGQAQGAWAWITPCHWNVGRDHIAMVHPQQLELSDDDSHVLLAAMQPYFEQDGIAFEYEGPTAWLARGDIFTGFASASLDRVIGRVIDPWLPRGTEARSLRRLQQEMQMLLYTHEVNEQRAARSLVPVNSFWVSGTGVLRTSRPAQADADLQIAQSLREAALRQDWGAWASGWHQLDEGECARLLARLDRGEQVALTLCGERNARTFAGTGGGFFGKLASSVRASRVAGILESL